jgi:hypothetical protein
MLKKATLAGLLVFAILALAAFTWLMSEASSAMRQVQAVVAAQSGRTLSVSGGAHLSFWPDLELVLTDADISGAGDLPLLAAREIRLQTGWASLFSSSPDIRQITLIAPRFNLLIDHDGHTAWDRNESAELKLPVRFSNGTIAYLDERFGQRLEVGGVTGQLSAADDPGGISFAGYGEWSNQHFEINSFVKSLARLTQDGSPTDISFRSPAVEFTFGGRMSLAKTFALAGRIEATIPDLRALMHRAGAAMADGHGLNLITFSGALDDSGNKVSIS